MKKQKKDVVPPLTAMPSVNLAAVTKDNLSNSTTMRDHVKRTDDQVKVPFKNLRVRMISGKRFNKRVDMGDLTELATSIKELGLLQPLRVYILENGLAVIEDGERRFRAIEMIRKESMEMKQAFDDVKCIVETKPLSDADRLIIQFTANTGKPFTPLEEADIFDTLVKENGMNMGDISRSTGKSIPYIEQRLLLANADDEERAMIMKKQISATAFVTLSRKTKKTGNRKDAIKASVSKNKKVKIKDLKSTPSLDLVNTALTHIKTIEGMNRNGKVGNELSELATTLRKLKKSLT